MKININTCPQVFIEYCHDHDYDENQYSTIYLSTSVQPKSENLTRVCEATCVVGTHANLEIIIMIMMLKMTVMMPPG